MRKIMIPVLCAALIFSLIACGTESGDSSITDIGETSETSESTMQINAAELTDEEWEMCLLVEALQETYPERQFYDYQIDDSVYYIAIRFYTLDENHVWQNCGGVGKTMEDALPGRILISCKDDQGFNIAWRNENSTLKADSDDTGITDEVSDSFSGTVWNTATDIVIGQEIPLAMTIVSNTESIAIGLNDFYEPENLDNYVAVTAVTITFSDVPIE